MPYSHSLGVAVQCSGRFTSHGASQIPQKKQPLVEPRAETTDVGIPRRAHLRHARALIIL